MKVYARYFSENRLNFRLNTVLQFGDSRNIIGASVLINPGNRLMRIFHTKVSRGC